MGGGLVWFGLLSLLNWINIWPYLALMLSCSEEVWDVMGRLLNVLAHVSAPTAAPTYNDCMSLVLNRRDSALRWRGANFFHIWMAHCLGSKLILRAERQDLLLVEWFISAGSFTSWLFIVLTRHPPPHMVVFPSVNTTVFGELCPAFSSIFC